MPLECNDSKGRLFEMPETGFSADAGVGERGFLAGCIEEDSTNEHYQEVVITGVRTRTP